jgi:hypothetical protein
LARGGIAAWIIAGVAGLVLFRLVAGWRYDLFMAAGNRQFGFQASGFFFWWLVWVLPFCIEFELHAIGNSAHFAADSLNIRDSLLWPPARHPYKELQSIELARPFNENPAAIGRPPECRFTFADGFRLTDIPYLPPFDSGGQRVTWETACQLVGRRSGQLVQVRPEIE